MHGVPNPGDSVSGQGCVSQRLDAPPVGVRSQHSLRLCGSAVHRFVCDQNLNRAAGCRRCDVLFRGDFRRPPALPDGPAGVVEGCCATEGHERPTPESEPVSAGQHPHGVTEPDSLLWMFGEGGIEQVPVFVVPWRHEHPIYGGTVAPVVDRGKESFARHFRPNTEVSDVEDRPHTRRFACEERDPPAEPKRRCRASRLRLPHVSHLGSTSRCLAATSGSSRHPITSVIVIFCIVGGILSKPEYEPHLDRLVWDAVRGFVSKAVDDTAGKTAYGASELNMAASRLAAWCWQSAGLPLERDVVFSRRVIARFIAIGCPTLKPAARGNLRSQLLRMSDALNDPDGVLSRRLGPLPPSDPAAPYSARERRSLSSWASTQSTAARRANAEVLIAAGAGAGLSAAEIGDLRVRDIEVDDRGVVLVIGGERPRRVPVLREWEQPLINRTKALAPERFAFRENHTVFYPNLISNFVDRSKVVGVRPQSQRLRSTWIVHHLNAATPVAALMRAAGVESLEALTRYVRFVREIPPDAERGFLRDA